MSASAGSRSTSFGPAGRETPGDPDIRALATRLGLRGLRYRSFTPPPIGAAVAAAETAPGPLAADAPPPAPDVVVLAASSLPVMAPPEASGAALPPLGLGFPLLAQAFARSAGAPPAPAADAHAPFAALRHAAGTGGR